MVRAGHPPFYEVSSRGDKSLSAFWVTIGMYGGHTIEQLYQSHKTFDGHSYPIKDYKKAKGLKPDDPEECARFYSHLWDLAAEEHDYIREAALQHTGFSDIFGRKGSCCQAIELFRIREKLLRIIK